MEEDAAFKALVILNRVSRNLDKRSLEDSPDSERALKAAISEWFRVESDSEPLVDLALGLNIIDPLQTEFLALLLENPSSLCHFADTFLDHK